VKPLTNINIISAVIGIRPARVMHVKKNAFYF
jgi:hypothetical protein